MADSFLRLVHDADAEGEAPVPTDDGDLFAGIDFGGGYRLHAPRLHAAQLAIVRHPARFKVVLCGRGFGKSTLAEELGLLTAGLYPGSESWYLGPSFPEVESQWLDLKNMLPLDFPGTLHETGFRLNCANGSTLRFRSGHVGERRLRGGQRHFVVFDEAASMLDGRDIWEKAVRPALSRFEGQALFIGTPRGQDWFAELALKAERGEPGWATFRYISADNPYLSPEEIETARANLPDRIFRQEFLAEVLEDGGGVFRGISACVYEGPAPAFSAKARYVIGCDWGKKDDFTWFVVLDANTGTVVELDRMNQVNYTLQRARLMALVAKWRAVAVLPERNSIGEPIIEQLLAEGCPIMRGPDRDYGFNTTAGTKPELIESLALALEQGQLWLPHDDVLLAELRSYNVHRLPSGGFGYSAPSGGHDDGVMALALARWASRAAHTAPFSIRGYG